MKSIKMTFVCLFMLVAFSQTTTAQKWRGIVPLRSTRADVERLLGSNVKSGGVVYELEDENVSVVYSSGLCTPEKPRGWNVPKDTVVSFTVAPRVKPRLADMKLNLRDFKRTEEPGNAVHYSNKKTGVSFDVEDGFLIITYYNPPAKYCHLYCDEPVESP